jgi:SAM-dependent methyltransferase
MTTDDSRDRDALRALVQVPTSHYEEGYDTPERFQNYWHQLQEATELGGRVLEIGIGNGAISTVLRTRGLEVVTVDIDRELGPDVVADIRDLPLDDGSFDGVLACEVLEHIPWDDVPRALGEIRRVARRWAVISVPSVGPAAALQASLPNALHVVRMMVRRRWDVRDGLWALSQSVVWKRAGGKVSHVGTVEPMHRKRHVFDGQHEWVLGEDGRVAEDVQELATSCGFILMRQFRPVGTVSHHFFVLGC